MTGFHIHSLPPATLVAGRYCFNRHLSVSLSTGVVGEGALLDGVHRYLWPQLPSGRRYLWIFGPRSLLGGGGSIPGPRFLPGMGGLGIQDW